MKAPELPGASPGEERVVAHGALGGAAEGNIPAAAEVIRGRALGSASNVLGLCHRNPSSVVLRGTVALGGEGLRRTRAASSFCEMARGAPVCYTASLNGRGAPSPARKVHG